MERRYRDDPASQTPNRNAPADTLTTLLAILVIAGIIMGLLTVLVIIWANGSFWSWGVD
jgi:hypothetical protein